MAQGVGVLFFHGVGIQGLGFGRYRVQSLRIKVRAAHRKSFRRSCDVRGQISNYPILPKLVPKPK